MILWTGDTKPKTSKMKVHTMHNFSSNPVPNPPRSMFRRNHNLKTTINTDYLYPIYVDECLPGDVFKFKEHLFARLSTPITPIMDNLYLDTFYFAIPVRLVDKDFKKLMGERPFGDVRNDYEVPQMEVTPFVGGLSDYLGLPLSNNALTICPWWHRAYNLVYNEWFRDENLCPARPVAGLAEDGTQSEETEDDYVLVKRGKRKDYFTSALPWPQKGSAASLPFNVTGSIETEPVLTQFQASSHESSPIQLRLGSISGSYAPAQFTPVDGTQTMSTAGYSSNDTVQQIANTFDVNFSVASQITVNQLRETIAIQHLLETDARGGTRYVELIRAHFNVISPDARQQRPEYLGGASVPLNVTTVAQTSATENSTPLGNLAAFVTANHSCGWTKTFTEHTLILGLANIRADLSYQQGIPRMFSRHTKYDFYWPELANLGEQAILNKEIFAQGLSADDDVFGYQERWAEYRYHPNMITGYFRSTSPLTLDYWHLAQKFDDLPQLSSEFINEAVPIDRVLAVTTYEAPNLILDGWFEVKAARLMPLFSVPGLGRL